MDAVNADATLRADFLAIHWYGWNAGSCDAKASQLESYIKWAEGFAGDRPIWITECGCLNQSAPDATTVVTFYKSAVGMFAKHPRIERYVWYPCRPTATSTTSPAISPSSARHTPPNPPLAERDREWFAPDVRAPRWTCARFAAYAFTTHSRLARALQRASIRSGFSLKPILFSASAPRRSCPVCSSR
jgi:hypothetical protein